VKLTKRCNHCNVKVIVFRQAVHWGLSNDKRRCVPLHFPYLHPADPTLKQHNTRFSPPALQFPHFKSFLLPHTVHHTTILRTKHITLRTNSCPRHLTSFLPLCLALPSTLRLKNTHHKAEESCSWKPDAKPTLPYRLVVLYVRRRRKGGQVATQFSLIRSSTN
jgi:hypothetical protein